MHMGDIRVKKITLPSGKVVELVYFLAAGSSTPEPVDIIETPRLERCLRCGDEKVCPVDWHEVADGVWHVELRCPECEWRRADLFDQETVDRYDDVLCEATDALAARLEQIERERMASDVERFVAALAADAITPFDF